MESKQEEFSKFKKLSNKLSGVITTNYDLLIDNALTSFTSYCGQDELLFNSAFNVAEIYHIHGSISKPETLVLTSDDYASFEEKQDYLAANCLPFLLNTRSYL